MKILVFDTETTGLMPKHKFGTPFPQMEEYPHIMQFSWIVYNISSNSIEEFNLDRQHNYQLLLVAITIFAWQAISNLAREFSF